MKIQKLIRNYKKNFNCFLCMTEKNENKKNEDNWTEIIMKLNLILLDLDRNEIPTIHIFVLSKLKSLRFGRNKDLYRLKQCFPNFFYSKSLLDFQKLTAPKTSIYLNNK